MKKAVKLVWMLLFALPVLSLTSCENDDDLVDNETGTTINLKDYSDLLDKTRDDVMKRMNIQVAASDEDGIYYENVAPGVEEVNIFYTFFEENEYGAQKNYDKSVMVEVDLTGFTYDEIYNFCSSKYGKGQMYDDMLVITKGSMYVWYEYDENDKTAELTFIKKSEWDKEFGEIKTKANDEINVDAFRALKDRVKAHRAK